MQITINTVIKLMHSCYHMWNENKSSHKKIVYWRIIHHRNSHLSSTFLLLIFLSVHWLARLDDELLQRYMLCVLLIRGPTEECCNRFSIFRSGVNILCVCEWMYERLNRISFMKNIECDDCLCYTTYGPPACIACAHGLVLMAFGPNRRWRFF